MRSFRTWANPLLAAALASGCALMQEPRAKAGDRVNTDAGGVFTLPKIDTGVSQTKTAIADFKQLNSASNFTMPIGNNFTMPIGNNLIGNVGAGYRIAAALSEQILFGFVPIPQGTDITRTGGPTGLPTETGAAQTATVGGTGDSNIDAALDLKWWKDSEDQTREGYKNTITYNRLKTTVNGESEDVTGTFSLRMSGPSMAGNWGTPDTSKTGGAILLGNNATPTTISRRIDAMDMKLASTSITVASVSVEQKNYENYDISLPQGANNQDPKKVPIQVPKTVNVEGFLTRPDAKSSLGINLAASLNPTAKLFKLSGWLKQCQSATCTASSAGTLKTESGEVSEEFTLDVASATSKLVFTKYPASSETFGWRMTLTYDYAVSLLKGKAPEGTTALTGDLWLIESGGGNVVGGKLADISSDADGNLKIKYPDDTFDTWKLF